VVPTADPATVPGLPESRLGPTDLAALPATSPPAPWTCHARAVAWLQRAPSPAFAWRPGRLLPLAAVVLVDYLDTPVGPYREVLAAAVLRRGVRPVGQVPFIAVDSLASVHGGRTNWALPKTVAAFDGDVGRGRGTARGEGWRVTVHAGRSGPGIPLRLVLGSTGPLGDATTRLSVVGRPVLVRSEVRGPTLGPWLGAGRHAGVLLEGEMAISAPGIP
jgi:hypothetical protein